MQKKTSERIQVGSLIDADLYSQAKALAAIQRRNTGEVIDDALREYLEKHGFGPKTKAKP
jgi:Xaa-Pro aminopeptidase